MKTFSLSALIISIAAIAFAQAPRVSDQIVVTASDLPETVGSTPASVTVITKKEINQQAARDVADVLREVPGLTVSRSGSDGKATSLFVRGGDSTQTLVLWNGIELNNPYFSGYDWGRFSTAGVSRVEVVRGPFSALYGSDAMTGVVNVVTAPEATAFDAEIEGGGHDLRNGRLSGAYAGSTLQINGALERRQDGGFNPNDDFHQNSGDLLARWTPTPLLSIGLAARHTSYNLGIPFNVNATGDALVPSPLRRENGTEQQLAAPLRSDLGRTSLELTLSDNRRSDKFHDPQDPSGFTEESTDSTDRRVRLVSRTATAAGTVVAGGEAERWAVNDSDSFGVNLQNSHRAARSLFVEDRWSGSHLQFSAGVRYDDFTTFGGQTSPRVAIAWIQRFGKLRAAYGTGFRAPSVGELYYPFAGNPKLHPEHSSSIEAGYDAPLGANGLLSVTLFRSRFRDLIVFDNQSFAFANIGRALTDGVELGAQQHIGARFDVGLSYTFLHRDDDLTTGQRLLRRPKHSGSLSFGWHAGATDTTLVLVRSGARFDLLPIAPYSVTTNRADTTIDANVQYRAGRFAPFVKAENLTNARYDEVLGFRSPARRLIVGLRFGI